MKKGLKNNEAFLDMILRPQAYMCAGISLQQQKEEESGSAFHNFNNVKLCDIFFLLVGNDKQVHI